MALGPVTSWQIDGETMQTVTDFIFLGSKITADGDCSHEIKRCLLLGRKAISNQDSILKSRDITLPTKVHLVKAIVFLVVLYGCESWTIKKAECSLSKKCKSTPQWGTITRQSEWLLSKSLQAINAGEGVEKREPSYTVGGNAN